MRSNVKITQKLQLLLTFFSHQRGQVIPLASTEAYVPVITYTVIQKYRTAYFFAKKEKKRREEKRREEALSPVSIPYAAKP